MTTPHHSHDPEKCRGMFEKLSEYIDNELDDVTCADIERHAAACIPCQICIGTLKRTIALCRETEGERVPRDVSARMKVFIQSILPSPASPPSP